MTAVVVLEMQDWVETGYGDGNGGNYGHYIQHYCRLLLQQEKMSAWCTEVPCVCTCIEKVTLQVKVKRECKELLVGSCVH